MLAEYRERRDAGAPGGEAALRAFVAAMSGNLGAVLLVTVVVGVAGAWGLVALFMPGYFDDPAQFALGRGPDADHVSLHRVHLAGGVRRCVAEQRQSLRRPRLHARAAERLADRRGPRSGRCRPGRTSMPPRMHWPGVYSQRVWRSSCSRFRRLPAWGSLVRPTPNWRHEGARKVGVLLVPAVVAASAGQINVLVSTVLASTLEAGSVSWLFYADRLMELPIGVVAVALGTVLITNLSRLHRRGEDEQFSAMLDWGLRIGLLLGVPAAAALVVLGLPLVATIFQHGRVQRPRCGPDDDCPGRLCHWPRAAGAREDRPAPGYFAHQGHPDAAEIHRRFHCGEHRRQPRDVPLARLPGPRAREQRGGLRQCRPSAARLVRARPMPGGRPGWGAPSWRRRWGRWGMVAALLYVAPGRDEWLAMGLALRIGWLAVLVPGGFVVFVLLVLAFGIRPRDLRHRA